MNKGSHPTRVHCQVENAPCYFNFRPRENQGRHKPKFPLQDDRLRQARRHRFIIGSGCVAILILVGAVIGLGFWVFQMKQALAKALTCPGPSNGTQQTRTTPGQCQTLRQFLCKPHGNHVAENSDCKLCPENWQRHGDKCYWISREKGTWNKSQNDCAAKDSQLAVIQKQVELDFIRHKTDGGQLLWIGVTTIPPAHEWSWVDGSPLNDTLLQVTGLAEANSCGMLKGKRVNSEACSAIAKWICETEVRLV
ncbi:Hypothetical predicted protein [Podarcis lilfordi]|uniref:C-type lectin domain-containing protein n=1 Tax=Podarcis lilfordi TaxID=74358 RepID=A0AA35P185_9SAUR|nr:Hypothetical predicted protein [Podarcis lilfordi]